MTGKMHTLTFRSVVQFCDDIEAVSMYSIMFMGSFFGTKNNMNCVYNEILPFSNIIVLLPLFNCGRTKSGLASSGVA